MKAFRSTPFRSYTVFALSDTDIKRCLEVCNTTERECIIRLGYTYGIRRDDFAKLTISGFDFDNNILTYYEEKKDRFKKVPLTPEVKIAIQKHINGTKRKTLFERPSGSTIYRRFQEILKDAGILKGDETRPFHALRGTCYKYWQRKGMPVEQIAELLGDTINTAMKHYGKATLNELSDSMERLK